MKRIWRIFLRICLWFCIISIVSVIFFRWIPVPVTPLMVLRSGQQLFDSKREVKLKKKWIFLEEISPNLQLAVVCSEDQNFLEHYGFDFDAIEKAVEHNEHSRHKRGASTISQQTAKNVFLWPGRSWIRKGMEVYFTFLIETFWSKERIMEVYLNVIEFGDGIYGAQAASKEFFKQDAKKLSREQAALLVSVLPNPFKLLVKNPSAYVRTRQSWIRGQIKNWGGELKYGEEEKEKK
ncbi:MAG: monofunctional biosynthetic peptidoglycan transglycosylase [Bacteroidetes bacterium]|nr:monofunctional biosynthetic peptidoglycan transglycosylase [Bacteroidota bacterium]